MQCHHICHIFVMFQQKCDYCMSFPGVHHPDQPKSPLHSSPPPAELLPVPVPGSASATWLVWAWNRCCHSLYHHRGWFRECFALKKISFARNISKPWCFPVNAQTWWTNSGTIYAGQPGCSPHSFIDIDIDIDSTTFMETPMKQSTIEKPCQLLTWNISRGTF